MTPLPPGPELDALVAKAMGVDFELWGISGRETPGLRGKGLWCPSTNRAQACGPVLDWLRSRVAIVGVQLDHDPDEACIVYALRKAGEGKMRDLASGSTLEHALSLAVLAIAEVK